MMTKSMQIRVCKQKLEYLWLDGCTPTQIRYKTKVVKEPLNVPEWGFDPIWGFDGSSTEQLMVIVQIVF